MNPFLIVLLVVLVVLIIGFFDAASDFPVLHFLFPSLKRKKEELRRQQEARDEEFRSKIAREERLKFLKLNVEQVLHIDFDTIQEHATQDEIVRIVNYLGRKAAESCALQSLNLRTDEYDCAARRDKGRWSTARSLAIKICPELADRMPYFGEFEPLKSYIAEHPIPATK